MLRLQNKRNHLCLNLIQFQAELLIILNYIIIESITHANNHKLKSLIKIRLQKIYFHLICNRIIKTFVNHHKNHLVLKRYKLKI
jgi:hypothetical protein